MLGVSSKNQATTEKRDAFDERTLSPAWFFGGFIFVKKPGTLVHGPILDLGCFFLLPECIPSKISMGFRRLFWPVSVAPLFAWALLEQVPFCPQAGGFGFWWWVSSQFVEIH